MANALDIIERKESGGRNVYQQLVPRNVSSASGHFQMIKPTWQRWARAAGVDINKYPEAINAPYDVQRQVAQYGFQKEGFKPWKATAGLVGQEANYGTGPSGLMSVTGTPAAPTDPTPSTPWTNQDLSSYYARKGIDTSGFGGALNKGIYTMLQDLPPELRGQITIKSGFRSPDYQAKLYADAVKKYGSEEAARKWVAPPGRSQHGFGNAADLAYASPAATKWAHENAAKYGLAFPLGNENWHVEAAGARAGGKPVNYALGVEGGQPAPDTGTGGIITAQGDAPPAPQPLMALQGFSDQIKKQEEAKAAPAPVQQAASPAFAATPPPAADDSSQVQAADLMGSLLARKRAMYAGGAPQQPPGILNPWSA